MLLILFLLGLYACSSQSSTCESSFNATAASAPAPACIAANASDSDSRLCRHQRVFDCRAADAVHGLHEHADQHVAVLEREGLQVIDRQLTTSDISRRLRGCMWRHDDGMLEPTSFLCWWQRART